MGSPSGPAPGGGPDFSSPSDVEDPVFAELKARISRLWDEGAEPADIQDALKLPR